MDNINKVINKTDKKELSNSFYNECQDQKFKDFALSLELSEDILMNYTSRLKEAFLECNNCKNCKDLSYCKNAVEGFKLTPIKEKNIINFSYLICEKLEENLLQEAFKHNLELFEMPKAIKEASLKNIYKDDKARLPIIKYFKEFIENYGKESQSKGLYLTGSFGSGKTYLIAALFNEMAKKNVKSILIYYPEFLINLKSSFNTNFQEKFSEIKKIPLLLLDDIGAENCSNWSRDEVLGPILQYRMDNHLPTFFTSNLTLQELEKSLSITSSGVDKVKARRIIERIKQLTVTLELISENRRD